MTAEDVKFQIGLIRASHRDYENAHSLEDKLLWEFVENVSGMGRAELADIVNLLLEWQKESADQPRYCA